MNTLNPTIDATAPKFAVVAQRPRYALHVVPGGFVGGVLGKHSFQFVADLDSAKHWESPEVIEEWLRDLPAGHANRLVDRSLFVVKCRFASERIVAAWNLIVPIAEPDDSSLASEAERAEIGKPKPKSKKRS